MRSVQVGIVPVDLQIDSENHRAYVLNLQSNNISVINTTSRDPSQNVTAIPYYGKKLSRVGIDDKNHRAYVTDEKDDTVSVIDGMSNEPSFIEDWKLKVGSTPTAIAVDSIKHKVYVANSGSDTISVIDGDENHKPKEMRDRIPVGASPGAIAIDPENDLVYVANTGDDTISVINSTAPEPAITTISVGSRPTAILVDTTTDSSSFTTKRILVVDNGDDDVQVIDANSFDTLKRIKVGSSPKAITKDSKGNLYVSNERDGTISVIPRECVTNKNNDCNLIENIDVGRFPSSIAIDKFTDDLYVSSGKVIASL